MNNFLLNENETIRLKIFYNNGSRMDNYVQVKEYQLHLCIFYINIIFSLYQNLTLAPTISELPENTCRYCNWRIFF